MGGVVWSIQNPKSIELSHFYAIPVPEIRFYLRAKAAIFS
jgi:hypothetical protein